MMRAAFTVFSIISVLWFPLSFTIGIVCVVAFFSPLTALSAGVLAELMYGAPQAYPFPLFLVAGTVLALVAFFVRRFIEASIIR